MTRLTEWILQSGHGRRSRKGRRQKPRSGRALTFERYEERLALSTTLGDVVSARMADAGEGGLIAFDANNFLGIAGAGMAPKNVTLSLYDGVGSGMATTHLTGNSGVSQAWDSLLAIERNWDSFDYSAYTSRFNGTSAAAPVVLGEIALMLQVNPELTWRDVNNSWSPTRSMLTGSAATYAVVDSGVALDHPDLGLGSGILFGGDLTGAHADFDANADLLSDVASNSPRVLPIPPPAAGSDDPSGGRIPMIAFTGVTGLSLARPDELGMLAKGRQPIYDPVVDEHVRPSNASPAESLRGRAVVYEVADVDGKVRSRGEGELDAELSIAEAERAGWSVTYVSARAPAADPNIGSASQAAARHQAYAAATAHARTTAVLFGEPDKIASPSASDNADSVPQQIAAGRDAAFEKWADESDSTEVVDAPVAATGDTRQRTAMGLALMLALGVRPMNRLFRSRRAAAAAEQRPRQRGWDGSLSQ